MQEINKKKALITGISGFVGPYLKNELDKNGYDVFGIDRTGGENVFRCDLLDKKNVEEVIEKSRPDYIYHLAGFSSVKDSWDKPELCRKINVEGTKNLLDAVVKAGLKPRILIVTSAEVYGKPKKLPLTETSPLLPESPYAKSRVEQEKLLGNYNDLDWVVARSFNHTGPGQPAMFVIPEFAKQLAEIKKGLKKPVIKVGNLEAKRDFSDVRDVVRAYRLLLEKGLKYEVYNVCSGKSYYVWQLLNKMIKYTNARKMIYDEVDEKKYRPVDIFELKGDNRKLKRIGFKFKYDIDKTLKDSLRWWCKQV